MCPLRKKIGDIADMGDIADIAIVLALLTIKYTCIMKMYHNFMQLNVHT